MTNERLREIFLESTPKISERFYPNEYISILANKATGLIQTEKQSEVCENCEHCAFHFSYNGRFREAKYYCKLDVHEITNPNRHSSLDFKRKEGKNG